MNSDRLGTLIEHGKKARETFRLVHDKTDALPTRRRKAWGDFLLSIATTESIEKTLIEPLQKRLARTPEMHEWLELHGSDEDRHFRLLSDYVRESFSQTKKSRTKSDLLVYDTLLPRIADLLTRRPACLIGVLYFYEYFSLDFYKLLKECAQADGLLGLIDLIQCVEKDELRHLAGLEITLESARALDSPSAPDLFAEQIALRALLELLLADINPSRWAIHNRRVRGNLMEIGMDPRLMAKNARKAAKAALRFIAKKGGAK